MLLQALTRCSCCLLMCRQRWLPALAQHPSYSAVCRVWDLLESLLRMVVHPERLPSDAEIIQFTADAEELGRLLRDSFPLANGKGSATPGSVQPVMQQQQVLLLDGSSMYLPPVLTSIEQLPQITAPAYGFSFYDHAIISHATWQLRQYGSLKRFGTWHVEHANAWWKFFLDRHTSRGGGSAAAGDEATSAEGQALRRYLMMTAPSVRGEMRKDLRLRAPRTCKLCGELEKDRHPARCVVRIAQQRDAEVLAAAAEAAATAAAGAAAATEGAGCSTAAGGDAGTAALPSPHMLPLDAPLLPLAEPLSGAVGGGMEAAGAAAGWGSPLLGCLSPLGGPTDFDSYPISFTDMLLSP